MPARLLIFSGQLKGKVLPLPPEGRVVLGRSQHAHITIPDTNLSRSHCAISATAKGYLVEDLESTNGTAVNGTAITQVILREGDRIVLGETDIEFRVKGEIDDTETKMDMVPIGEPEPMSPADALKSMGLNTNTPAAPTARASRLRFCEVCDGTIPGRDVSSSKARDVAGKFLCAGCIGRLAGKNLDAVANFDAFFDKMADDIRREQQGA